jgi:hypothetical protein
MRAAPRYASQVARVGALALAVGTLVAIVVHAQVRANRAAARDAAVISRRADPLIADKSVPHYVLPVPRLIRPIELRGERLRPVVDGLRRVALRRVLAGRPTYSYSSTGVLGPLRPVVKICSVSSANARQRAFVERLNPTEDSLKLPILHGPRDRARGTIPHAHASTPL